MTEEQLMKQIEDNIEAEKQAAAEKAKRLPISLKVGPGSSLQNAGETAGETAMKRLGLRDYALDAIGKAQVSAFAVACVQHRLNLVDAFEKLVTVVPGWKQTWRPDKSAGTVPELPIDPCTGLRARNPFLPLPPLKPGETTPHYDHASQAMAREQSPALAEWLEACARNGGEPSLAMLDKQDAEKIEADYVRALPYGANEYASNRLRKDQFATITERMQWEKGITDAWVIKAHRAEAELGSPRIGYGNLTYRMKLWHISPELCEAFKTGEKLFKSWEQKAA